RPELDAVVARFGRGVVDATGALDREALARIVFADASAREDLEAIVHPAVRGAIARELDARRRGSDVVVVEIPLLVETGGRERFALDRVLVVEAPEDVAIARLVSSRTLSEQEARARIAAQATPEARRSAADVLIVNDGTRAELESDVARAWAWLEGVAAGRAEV
nr:dephospho-CoA kinase [Actinomycetota bacterium]